MSSASSASIYECTVAHVRTTPVVNRFRYSTYLWLVDLDDLPAIRRPVRPLARFLSRDHLGDPDRSIRENVDTFLAARGVDLDGGSVRMLTAARVLGYVFNPLSIYWCHDRVGSLECVVAEVHNTYGERHCYLVPADRLADAVVTKEFYVSPFESVQGHYRMTLPEPGDDVALTITLDRSGQAPFVATVRGTRHPATTRRLLLTAMRHPMAPLMVAARIRRQGISLWRRGLTVVPRPFHPSQEAVR